MPLKPWQTVASVSTVWIFCCIMDLKYWMSDKFSKCWHTVCQISDTHLLCVCVCLFCVVLVVLFYNWALNCVMVHDNTGIYVGFVWWCDIHCRFLSTFREFVLPDQSVCMISMLPIGLLHIWQCKIIAFCIIFGWYFVHVILSLFHVLISPPVESVYWFHQKYALATSYTSHLCGVNFLLCVTGMKFGLRKR